MVRGEEQNLPAAMRASDQWQFDVFAKTKRSEIDRRFQQGGVEQAGKLLRHSHSGEERNHLFLNQDGGRRFADASPVSGLDTPADSRAVVYWDFNRDGWQDIAVANANPPLLNLFRNEIGQLSQRDGAARNGRMLALRFVGGNQTSIPSASLSTRDGYGAQVTVALDEFTIMREHRCGEGFAAQNSATMVIGIGDRDAAGPLAVVWPSGVEHTIPRVSAGTLLTVYENADEAPGPTAFVATRYQVPAAQPYAAVPREFDPPTTLILGSTGPDDAANDRAQLNLYTTMATWCLACKRHLPQLSFLRSTFSANELSMFGIPVDASDDADKLEQYLREHRPPYQLVMTLRPDERSRVARVVQDDTGESVLPTTIVTDQQGQVLARIAGVPHVSELRRLLESSRQTRTSSDASKSPP